MRRILAVVTAAAVAALGAGILGEYPLQGVGAPVAGAVFGLVVGRAAVAVAGGRDTLVALAAAMLAAAGIVWAGWISTGHDLDSLRVEGWAAVVVALVTAVVVTARRPSPAGGTPPAT